ncbi:hypothetical protein [Pendulispora albinea]|uniref:Baseplate assembly protein n=1 Tax=Pendulispora albinea TaxID=2741071 RepID=A0ABZ2MAR6_9BACT
MSNVYFCQNAARRQKLRGLAPGPSALNGIDYLEVCDLAALAAVGSPAVDFRQRILLVHTFRPLPAPPSGSALTASDVTLRGGVSVQPIVAFALRATELVAAPPPALAAVASILQAAGLLPASQRDATFVVVTDRAGDFSPYELTLAAPAASPPAPSFDIQLGTVSFSFKTACPSALDCVAPPCPEPTVPAAPELDYLTKDYLGFRQLMLDRLAVVSPDLTTDNAADLSVVLVELLAHAADKASYFQDAVANEAYLGTARRRISVRRHARLLDYTMGEGSNARAFVQFRVAPSVGSSGVAIPGPSFATAATPRGGLAMATASGEVFETMHALTVYPALNRVSLYTWGDAQCCLPAGATRATLEDTGGALAFLVGAGRWAPGALVIFQEVVGPLSGLPEDADPRHRHVVRLTSIVPNVDPLYTEGGSGLPQRVVDIAWAPEDALPFPLCVSSQTAAGSVSVALGNVALADHGQTIVEGLPPVADGTPFRPALAQGPLSWQVQVQSADGHTVPFDAGAPASAAVVVPRGGSIAPAIALVDTQTGPWQVRGDLLESDALSQDFVVETDDDGIAVLRFGDGTLGRRPSGELTATYRVGNGPAGNVGADAITRLVLPSQPLVSAGLTVTNPLPAAGGTAPETLDHVRLDAPQAFRVQRRAVTAADYAAAAELHPDVQRAHAVRRFTGSWSTFFIAVERFGGRPADDAFRSELAAILEPFRMAGQDFVIQPAKTVPLEIVLGVCVAQGFLRADVAAALGQAFGAGTLPDQRRGFFHPDNFTLGQPLYLSQVLATATSVPGVASIDTSGAADAAPRALPFVFRRTDRATAAPGDPSFGVIPVAPSEVIRVDNDINQPQNGRITFVLEGGA